MKQHIWINAYYEKVYNELVRLDNIEHLRLSKRIKTGLKEVKKENKRWTKIIKKTKRSVLKCQKKYKQIKKVKAQ